MKIEIVRVQILPPVSRSVGVVTERCQTPDGVTHEGTSCIYKAARHLIAHGVAPRTRMRVVRDDRTALTGTVEAFAVLAWGGDTKDPYPRTWKPRPEEVLPPILQAWWEAKQR